MYGNTTQIHLVPPITGLVKSNEDSATLIMSCARAQTPPSSQWQSTRTAYDPDSKNSNSKPCNELLGTLCLPRNFDKIPKLHIWACQGSGNMDHCQQLFWTLTQHSMQCAVIDCKFEHKSKFGMTKKKSNFVLGRSTISANKQRAMQSSVMEWHACHWRRLYQSIHDTIHLMRQEHGKFKFQTSKLSWTLTTFKQSSLKQCLWGVCMWRLGQTV